ncbi:MAG: T9SS type A sorting domain-containing protein [Paludibacter sp.]|nr:T9SS type A sorting domain-containing protein [Paludibacter sp.]
MKQLLYITIRKYMNITFGSKAADRTINLRKKSIVWASLILFVFSLNAQNPPQKIMHFSFDDSYNFLIDLKAKKNSYKSIFENPLLGKLKSYHDTYGAVFSLYCFTYSPGAAWNIEPLPIAFAEELVKNSDWLKLGFHGKNSGYSAADWRVQYYYDFQKVLPDIEGREKCFDLVPRLSSFGVNSTLVYCDSLRDATPGLLGFLTADDTRNSYYLNTDQSYYINHNDSLYDAENKLYFFRSEWRLEGVKSMVPFLAQYLTPTYANRCNVMPIFTHEYGVYNSKLGLLDKGLFQKIDTCITWAIQNNYKFDYPMNIVKKRISTGINSSVINSDFIIVRGKTISSKKIGSFNIFNMSGALVLQQKNVSSINTNLSSGIYALQFIGIDGGSMFEKIIIK